MTKFTVNFRDDSFYPQIRKKYFTMIDWFSFVGGILGLFFGFSFLSAFEIIFHTWMLTFGGKPKKHLKIRRMFVKTSKSEEIIKKVRNYIKNFMTNSSIHSFSYIPDKNLKIYER